MACFSTQNLIGQKSCKFKIRAKFPGISSLRSNLFLHDFFLISCFNLHDFCLCYEIHGRLSFNSPMTTQTITTGKAKSNFEKDLYKLLNNALFGKTTENVRGRKDCKLRNTE